MNAPPKKDLNYITLAVFAPILILAGVLGFVLPDGLLSNAPAYNVFHIVFGVIGLILIFAQNQNQIRAFNIGFGLIDLYQALASFMDWFPESYFQWRAADDTLHIIIGAFLIMIGLFGKKIIFHSTSCTIH